MKQARGVTAMVASEGSKPTRGSVLDQADIEDLVDDRALSQVEDDLLGHSEFATQLAWLASNISTPANIGLFGRWGSGKSGLANLVRGRIESLPVDQRPRLVKFDAFKWSEQPLLRQFLLCIAREVKDDPESYARTLYESTTYTRIRSPDASDTSLAKRFGLYFTVALAIPVLVLLGLARFSEGPYWTAFWELLAGGAEIVPVAVLLSGVAALATRTFATDHTRQGPSSGEQFEERFKELVAEIKKQQKKRGESERVVVFVDELDRCSSEEVVRTLEALKTFLEVDGCVFIVAADQQVLVEALDKQARQATPVDGANPYYSAGSAYMDKIFQHQLSLPPLRPRRLSRFALALVEKRGGVWSELTDLHQVISVLIPTHVRSPRRVKVLLNHFAMAYRLAQKRVKTGALGDLRTRAAELAKLVCLRTEFPLFAADLAVDSRLTGLVLSSARREMLPEAVPQHLKDRARRYAQGHLPVDQYLSSAETSDRAAAEGSTEEDLNSAVDSVPESHSPGDVRVAHALQLVHYLEKTAHIGGPRRDLIHLEAPGFGLGVEPEIADQLEEAAIDRRASEVLGVLEHLDPTEQAAALRLLAERTREAAIGVEAANVITCLLRALGGVESEVAREAGPSIANSLAAHRTHYELRPEDLAGTLTLALSIDRAPDRESLIGDVLARGELFEDTSLGLMALNRAHVLAEMHGGTLAKLVAHLLLHREVAHRAAAILSRLEERLAVQVLLSATSGLSERLRLDDETMGEGDESSLTELAVVVLDQFIDAGRPSLAYALAWAALEAADPELDAAVKSRLGRMGPVESPSIVKALVIAAGRDETLEWESWLAPLRLNSDGSGEVSEALERLLSRVWDAHVTGDFEPETLRRATSALLALRDRGVQWDREAVSEKLADRLPDVGGLQDAGTLDGALRSVAPFVDTELLADEPIADATLDRVGRLLAAPLPSGQSPRRKPQPVEPMIEDVTRSVRKWYGWCVSRASSATVRRFVDSAEGWVWLSEAAAARLKVAAAAELRGRGESIPSPIGLARVRDLVLEDGEDGILVAVSWIRAFVEDPDELSDILVLLSRNRILTEPVQAACVDARVRMGEAPYVDMVRMLVGEVVAGKVALNALESVAWRTLDDDAQAQMLIDLVDEGLSNNTERHRILALWEAGDITAGGARAELIQKVFLPLAGANRTALDQATKHLALVAPPPAGVSPAELGRSLQALVEQHADGKTARRFAKRLKNANLVRPAFWERFRS